MTTTAPARYSIRKDTRLTDPQRDLLRSIATAADDLHAALTAVKLDAETAMQRMDQGLWATTRTRVLSNAQDVELAHAKVDALIAVADTMKIPADAVGKVYLQRRVA